MKREDLAGPGAFSGSKTRLAEFIIGEALQEGVTHIITQGASVTNSGMQFSAACLASGITPIVFVTRDVPHHGKLEQVRGNYLLMQIMGVETHVIDVAGNYWETPAGLAGITNQMEARKKELEAAGAKVKIVATGGAHPAGFIGHTVTFKEIIEQATAVGVKLDYIYHTAGTGTALPGMLAGKFLFDSDIKFRSIAITSYNDDDWSNPGMIIDRAINIFHKLGVAAPNDKELRAELDIDQGFIGEDYAVPSPESTAAIKELASLEGIFAGPVYTGKGLAGMLAHARSGKIPKGSNVMFLHTGDAVNLFEIEAVTGDFS